MNIPDGTGLANPQRIETKDPVVSGIIDFIELHPHDTAAYDDMLTIMKDRMFHGLYGTSKDWHRNNRVFRNQVVAVMNQLMGNRQFEQVDEFNGIYRRSLLIDAPVDFDAFNLYLEINRDPNEQFYLPRRKVLAPIVRAFQEVQDGEIDLLTVSQPKRTGKALPVDTPVLTPDGYVPIGKLKIGDSVISAGGNATAVTGVFPQGRKDVYEVTFSETGKCSDTETIECCGEHLWTVQTEDDREKGTNRTLSTDELMNGTLYRGHDRHNNYSVDYVGPVRFNPVGELKIKPYTMGVLIAEGGLGGAIRFSSADKEIVNRVESELPEGDIVRYVAKYDYAIVKSERKTDKHGYIVKSKTGEALSEYGLHGKKAYEKHIPKEYLFASVEERTELLQALFDCDGGCSSNGCEYSTTSEQLARDVVFLVRGLGGRARVVKRMGSYLRNGYKILTRMNYRVYCKFPADGIVPFSLQRKLDNYHPMMKKLRHFISGIKKTDRSCEMVCISVADESKQYIIGSRMIPTHNTTLGTRFVLFRGGQNPNSASVCSGSGDMLVKSFYNGMLEIVRDPEKYTFNEIFPDAVLVNTNADEKIFNLKDVRRFATVTCRSIDGALTGSTEATPDGVLYLDDMVANEEEAVNLARLDFLWDKIRGDLLGRRLEGCPIVAQGTRYSVHDPIGHLQEEAPRMGWRTKVLEIPALDPVTDESNFEIEIKGRKMFTTAFYRNERKLVTEQQWESQFQQRPFEKKGRLYKANELRRYFDLPADREPDAIIAVCDTKDRGKDYASMPIGYQYGNDYFIEDVVCDNGVSAMVREKLALALVRNNVQIAQFESNSAGGLIAEDVTKRVKELGGTTSIRTKFTSENKETKIIVNQPWVLEHCLFKDESRYKPDSDYGIFMRFLTQYTMSGKGQIDDPPDSMSMFAIFAQGQRVATVTPMRRPW